MARFIELHDIDDNESVLINIDQIAYIEISEFGSVIHLNLDSPRKCINVRESFQTIKRELVY